MSDRPVDIFSADEIPFDDLSGVGLSRALAAGPLEAPMG